MNLFGLPWWSLLLMVVLGYGLGTVLMLPSNNPSVIIIILNR